MSSGEQDSLTPRENGTSETLSVGAVIVNFNGGERVLRAIEALHRQTYALAQIIVVDNNSTDDSPQRICQLYPTVRLMQLPSNTGLSAARNSGLNALKTTLAFIVDHDIYANDTAIELMVAAYDKHETTVICPRIRLIPERGIVQMEGAAIHFLSLLILRHGYTAVESLPNQGDYVDAFTGGCLLLHRQSVLDAGGFDELFFFYFEDLELALRLRLRGHRFWCEPRAEVFHEPGEGTPGLSYRRSQAYPRRRAYLTMRNRLLVILIHYRVRTILLLLPTFVLFELAALLMACHKRWPAEWFRAWYWQATNMRKILRRRLFAMRGRKCRDRDILVGGPPPLAPDFVASGLQKSAVALFSLVVNGYWSLVRRWIA